MDKVRLGVIGAGNIASAFVRASPSAEHTAVTGIASRSLEKAQEFAKRLGLAKAYGSYDAVLDDPDIDAVYIATPNGAHKEWAIKAARAGKHILCEKPMALTVADAREMFQAAKDAGVILIEAFPFRFQPQTIAVLEEVRSGAIGEIVTFTGCFGFRMRSEENVRMIPEQGGGALWDVGVYPINLARAVFDRPPSRVFASAKMHAKGVDVSATAVLEYEDGRSASIWCSFETNEFRRAAIVGSEGSIDYAFGNHTDPGHATYSLRIGGAPPVDIRSEAGNGFALEADAFALLIRGESERFSGTSEQETLENTASCYAALRSISSGYAEVVLV